MNCRTLVLLLLVLDCFGCAGPQRPVGEEDRGALEAQAKGEDCGFRSSLLSRERSSLWSNYGAHPTHSSGDIPEQERCYRADSFLTFLNPGSLGCRNHALDCLARLPHSSLSIPTLKQVAASPLPEHDWAGVRREDLYGTLAFALGTTDDERATPVLILMLEQRGPRQSVVDAALNALGRLGVKAREAGPRLRELAAAEQGAQRHRFLAQLVKVDPENSRELLEESLSDSSKEVRTTALQSLATVAPEVAARHLSALAPTSELDSNVAKVLPTLPMTSESQEAVLIRILATTLDTGRSRETVLTALTSVGKLPSASPRLCQSLVGLARVSNLSIVEKSYKALGVRCQRDTLALVQAKEDAVSSVAFRRRIATEFLGKVFADKGVGCPNWVATLLRRLRHDSAPTVREAADTALNQIGLPEGSTEKPGETLDEASAQRNRALHDIAGKALRIGTLRSHFAGFSHRTEISGTILSTANDQHRVEKTEPFNGTMRHEISSYVGNEAWTITTTESSHRGEQREIRRELTDHQASPPFTPLLPVGTSTDGSMQLYSFATYDGKEWLTEYAFIREEVIQGESCYLFEHQSDSNRRLKWISARLGVLCKEESYYSGGGLNTVDNETPFERIEYSAHEINVPVTLAAIIVQPKPGEVVREYSYINQENREREFVWQGSDQ